MGKIIGYVTLLIFMSVSAAFAVEGCSSGPCANCHTLTLKEANELLSSVGRVTKVESAPVEGLWLLHLEKDNRHGVVFMDYGKKNLIAGTIFPIAPSSRPQKPVDGDAMARRIDVASLPPEHSIVLGNPRGKKKLFVFTDPDCPFCAKQHAELKALAAADPDLAIYVKMFPLAMHPQAYDKARAILDGNSPELLDRAFSGAKLEPPRLERGKKAVDDTIKNARSLGIDATPTLVLPDGRVVAGYRDAAALGKLLAAANWSGALPSPDNRTIVSHTR